MWFTRRKASTSSGFSLTEALVALAIAAFLAAILTRFVSTTRANALRIRQEVAMDILGNNLLERLGARDLRAGRTDGRDGALGWYIDVATIPVSAQAIVVAEKKPITSTAPTNPSGSTPAIGPSRGVGAAAAQSAAADSPSTPSWAAGLLPLLTTPNPETAAQTTSQVVWTNYRVTAVIKSPSGRTYAVDTIRLGGQRLPTRSEQAATR